MKIYNPTTNARRNMTGVDYGVLSKVRPTKSLVRPLKKTGGRNSQGRITSRHRGGGNKRLYRMIDFGENKRDVKAKVLTLEYDPNRTAFIALIQYADNEKRYILAPFDLKVGDEIIFSESAPLKIGNRLPLTKIPVGTFVYNVELVAGNGGQLGRSAGSSLQVMAQEGGWTHLLLPSSEIRRVSGDSWASLGTLSNPEWNIINWGKAGKSRWKGIRPHVRGSVMNPRDHPHGGGEGKTTIGLKGPKTPWGKPARGVKTRKRKKSSNKFIMRRRIK
ncbi:MAG: 50S ribosomal protein L2 [Parcubacteria group bacterium]|nr:50S ribosomal protein L2 [Parcubacteria group bacterium]